MEIFLKIWSSIVMAFLLIATALVAFGKDKINKDAIILLMALIPMLLYIIKF